MEVRILIFGSLTEIVGSNSILFPLEKDSHSLLEKLNSTYPLLKEKKFEIALDKKIIHENTPLHSSSEIALLPPFSGG